MEIVNAAAESYVIKYSSPEDALLAEISEYTHRTHTNSQMLSGHIQGKVLEMISALLKPKRILEIGTYTGYSALCLAKGLVTDGELHTIELRPDDATIAKDYFKRSLYNNKLILHQGDARAIIPTLKEEWDIVFIDADKVSYIDYYELVLPRLKQNGLIIADNVLFHGEVLEDNIQGKNAIAIEGFNKHVAMDSRTENVILTVRDGLALIRKL